MTDLFDILTAAHDRIISAWVGQIAKPGDDTDALRRDISRGYDGLVSSLHSYDGEAYRHYVNNVVKPSLRQGMNVAAMHTTTKMVQGLIAAEIDRVATDKREREHLHEQLNMRIHNALAVWEAIASQIGLEDSLKRN